MINNKLLYHYQPSIHSFPFFRHIVILLLLFAPLCSAAQLSSEQELKVDSLKQIIVDASHDTIRINALMAWDELIVRVNPKKSMELNHRIVELIDTKLNEETNLLSRNQQQYYHKKILLPLNRLGLNYKFQGKYTKSLAYLLRSLELSESLDEKNFIAKNLSAIGDVYLSETEYDKALEYQRRSLQLAEDIGQKKLVVIALGSVGDILLRRGNYAEAIENYTRCLQLSEEINLTYGVVMSYKAIGDIHQHQGKYDKAITFLNKSMQLAKENNYSHIVSEILFRLGVSYEGQKNYTKALEYFNYGLKENEASGDSMQMVMLYNSIGICYMNQGETEKALDHYVKSLKVGQRFGSKMQRAKTLNNISEVYIEKGRHLEALANTEEALAIAQEIGVLLPTKKCYRILYQIYKKQKKYPQALRMHEQFMTFRDSIQSEKNQREVIRQEYKYDYEKQALADSLQNAEAQKLADAELSAQKAQNLQQRQQSIFGGIGLLSLLAFSGFAFYQRRKSFQKELELEQKEALRLKELDSFKTRLYTNLTHEFRTPLTVMLGMAEKVRQEPQNFLDEGTHLIERNGKNLLRLINQLLDLSKLENQSFQLHLQQADVIPYLHYITESFHSYANGKNLSLRFFSTIESLLMDYDVEQIKMIMTNLISNAIKFTPSGGEVKVRITKEENSLIIEVKDSGVGIPAEALPLIFDRFYQVDGSSTKEGTGTGIGLAHTRELVKLMGGKIEVESILEKGSTFNVQLPIRNVAPLLENTLTPDMDLMIPENLAAPEIIAEEDQNDLPRLLIIEDNPDVVVYLKSCLDKEYQLDVAYNGAIGIEKAIETIPDVIISDVMMPGKDGFEVCNTLKTDERTSHIPIVLLTAKADLSSKLEGLERGADAYLAKPFHKEELMIRLKKLLDNRQMMTDYFKRQYLQTFQGSSSTEVAEEVSKDLRIEDVFIQKVNAILEAHIQNENFGLPELRKKAGMSSSQLFRKMKALTNTAPSEYIRTYRLQKAKHLLEQTDFNVAEAAYEVGFKDPSYFAKVFQKAFGVSPSAFKDGK